MIPDTFCILAGGRIFVKVRIDIFGCTDYDIAMKNIFKNIRKKNRISYVTDDEYEYCRYCEANLTLQKGYSNDLPYWVCKGCGQMLINPNLNTDSDIIWTCDGCETLLNEQPGFTEKNGSWKCTACGFVNSLDKNHVYVSEDEYQAAVNAPYNGISNEDMLALMSYEVIGSIENREDVLIVKDEDGNLYVEKILDTFDESIYQYLMEHPIANMPQIMSVYRGITKLVIIEQWIDGVTIEDMLKEYTIKEREAVRIACDICKILKELHSQKTPIIHRDVKPSNVMLCQDAAVCHAELCHQLFFAVMCDQCYVHFQTSPSLSPWLACVNVRFCLSVTVKSSSAARALRPDGARYSDMHAQHRAFWLR